NGVHIFTDHRNLAYIFNPEACVTSVSKALAQRLEGWKGVLGQYRYTICHISGERNAWSDFLSRWVNIPTLPARAVAVYGPCEPDDSMPSKSVVRQAQRKDLGADDADVQYFESDVGTAILDNEGLFRVYVRGRNVLWIPSSDKQLQVRMMICAHMRDAGYRTTTERILGLAEVHFGTETAYSLIDRFSLSIVPSTTLNFTKTSFAASLLNWFKTLGVPRVWVSDTATHYEDAILARLREALRADNQFAVA
ncbi:unnamed protein product, partial [Sphacelaria rigidula]